MHRCNLIYFFAFLYSDQFELEFVYHKISILEKDKI